ncbi:hypothetical protein HK105_203130 [Polyrhizophydium stewartii]|uniref:Secretory carrier membrane protein n=1 Tax=Polyrhizophydium stewartii TaxID=2732419 RepID=A0ABR4NDE7_9FUNG|nr:Secretory carrier-associated membrane protein 5 [Polyrhizophydium stewartii]
MTMYPAATTHTYPNLPPPMPPPLPTRAPRTYHFTPADAPPQLPPRTRMPTPTPIHTHAHARVHVHGHARYNYQVAQRERETGDYHPPNWPSFRPLVYHDIENDIPKNGQWLVKRVYTAWWLAAITFIINFIAAFALLIKKADGAGATFGMSLLLLVLGVPFSFVFWYRALYDGVKRDSSIKFMFFFFNYAVHLAAMGIFAIGITGWGGAGVIYTLSMFSTDMGAAVLCLIASCCFIFQIIYGLWQVKAVHGYWRSKGLTTEQARDQAIHTVASSRVGQEVGRAAVKQAVASNTR